MAPDMLCLFVANLLDSKLQSNCLNRMLKIKEPMLDELVTLGKSYDTSAHIQKAANRVHTLAESVENHLTESQPESEVKFCF